MQWYYPVNLKAWMRRMVALRSVVLLLMMMAMAVTEFRFDWIERLVGNYLSTTNASRPESGAIWDQGHQTDSARQALSQYMSQVQTVQREARRAASLGQVVAGIDANQGAMISADHFIELYLKLPPILSHEIISPFTLLAYINSSKWRRTFFEQQDQQLAVYLLDDHNQVLHRLAIGPSMLGHIQRGEVAIQSSLYHLADFAAHIYPAAEFFKALNSLPESTRKGIITEPEELLRISGRIVRVGISDRSSGETVDLGFEVEELDDAKVILVQGQTDDVRRLIAVLEGQPSGYWIDDGEEMP
jgi:hypothetical protein